MNRHILIVDDERYIRQGLKGMIEYCDKSAQVDTARDGLEAIAMLDQKRYALVFTDVSMPGLSGLELIRHIRQGIEPTPPVIIISGHNDFNYAVEGLRNGVVDYLLKPIHRDDVYAILRRSFHKDAPGTPPAARVDSRELLERDIKCAILDPEISQWEGRSILRRITALLGTPCKVICMRINSQFLRASLVRTFTGETASPGMLLSVGGNDVLLCANVPDFLGAEQSLWAGVSTWTEAVSIREAVGEAATAMRAAFFTGRQVASWPVTLVDQEPSQAELTRILYQVEEGKIGEAQRIMTEHMRLDEPREDDPFYAERFLRALLDALYDLYPDLLSTYHTIVDKLRNPLQFGSLAAYLQELYGFLYILSSDIRQRAKGPYEQYLIEAVDYIQKHYQDDINLAVVANHVGLNYSVLSREFSRQTGRSFVNYLKELRIEHACRLLREQDGFSKDIARAVGFQSERQFSIVFKSIMGVAPMAYRRMKGEQGGNH